MDGLYRALQGFVRAALRKPMVAERPSEKSYKGFIGARLNVAGSASWELKPLRTKPVREHDPGGLVIEAYGGNSTTAEATMRISL